MNRAELGASLRALRQSSGREAKAVARNALMSASKLSKIENGRVAPSAADVDRILSAIGVSDEVKDRYVALARVEATEVLAWRLVRRMGHHRKQRQAQALEAQMSLLRLFQQALVPGLMQTAEYMRAVMSRHGVNQDEMARNMGVRIDRQRVLYDTSKDFQFVITEPVLRWRIVPPAMMASQLDRLLSVSRLPNVHIRIVPLQAAQRDFANHSFVIRDDRMVTVETIHAELTITDPRDVARYVSKFERFFSAALSGNEARALIERVRDEFLTEHETS